MFFDFDFGIKGGGVSLLKELEIFIERKNQKDLEWKNKKLDLDRERDWQKEKGWLLSESKKVGEEVEILISIKVDLE